jgi:transposase
MMRRDRRREGQSVAEVVAAETGADMSRFRTAAHLASWAGVCPGQHKWAGKRRFGKTRHTNRWLMGTSRRSRHLSTMSREMTCVGLTGFESATT